MGWTCWQEATADLGLNPVLTLAVHGQALPTLMLFRDGRIVDRIEGFQAEPALSSRVRYYLAGMDKKFGRR